MLTGRSYILSASATSAVPLDGYCAPQKTASICACGSSRPASAYASYAASTIMSSGDLSQFSPNLQQPIPTMATLSRIASGVIVTFLEGREERCQGVAFRSTDRRALPEVVRRADVQVDLTGAELARQVELQFLGAHVGHLKIEPRAAIGFDHAHDHRRVGAAGEEVEGVGQNLAGAVGEAHLVELVAREAAVADALER